MHRVPWHLGKALWVVGPGGHAVWGGVLIILPQCSQGTRPLASGGPLLAYKR